MLSSLLRKIFHTKSSFEIFTDGSSKDGQGAWAFVITRKGKILHEAFAAVPRANSNAMEFRAAIEALKALQAFAPNTRATAILHSDSRILVDSMTTWKVQERRPAALRAEIVELDQLSEKNFITWRWIKAHAGHEFNERCDELCLRARQSN